jgi:hypothetical protein
LIPKVVAIVYDAGSGIRFCFLKAFIDDVAVTSMTKSSSSVVVLQCNASAGTCIPKINNSNADVAAAVIMSFAPYE